MAQNPNCVAGYTKLNAALEKWQESLDQRVRHCRLWRDNLVKGLQKLLTSGVLQRGIVSAS